MRVRTQQRAAAANQGAAVATCAEGGVARHRARGTRRVALLARPRHVVPRHPRRTETDAADEGHVGKGAGRAAVDAQGDGAGEAGGVTGQTQVSSRGGSGGTDTNAVNGHLVGIRAVQTRGVRVGHYAGRTLRRAWTVYVVNNIPGEGYIRSADTAEADAVH